MQNIQSDEGCQIDHIARGSEYRRITELQFFQVFQRSVHGNERGDHVDPFVNISSADGLRAQNASGRFFEDQLEMDGCAVRHQTDLVHGHGIDRFI